MRRKNTEKKQNCFCTPCSWQQEEDDGAWWDWHFSCTQAFQQLTPLSQSHPQNADLQVLFCCLCTHGIGLNFNTHLSISTLKRRPSGIFGFVFMVLGILDNIARLQDKTIFCSLKLIA